MPDLIVIKDSRGQTLAACGPACYEGHTPDPSCICAGTNCGLGIRLAAQNLLAFRHTFLELWSEHHPYLKPDTILVHPDIRRLAELPLP